HLTGNVSYDPDNHDLMVRLREEKVDKIADDIPPQQIEAGHEEGDLLLLGWGSTYGVIESVTRQLLDEGHKVAHAHLRYIRPFPHNLGDLLKRYRKVVVPEINRGQLARVLRAEFLLPVVQFNRVRGVPISHKELYAFAKQQLAEMADVEV
ncbi:MAG: 2-oxoglutarate ferredoxin oxidoreductase subunit alpha, partial [Bacteroidetes bacterium]